MEKQIISKVSPWYYKIKGELIKKPKPCSEDDYVHINKWDGCYRVYGITLETFCIRKNREFVWLPWTEFRCKSGEGNSMTKYEKLRDRKIISKINTEIRILEKAKDELKGK